MSPKVLTCFSILCLIAALVFGGCSKSDDQRRYEDRALADPQGITQTDGTGKLTGSTDNDDWEIAPMFSGLVEVEIPAHPNPVALNSSLRIELYIAGLETLGRIEVYAFEFPGQMYGPLTVIDNSASTSLITVHLNAGSIANTSGGAGATGEYRLLLYDGRENMITYGDVRVQ